MRKIATLALVAGLALTGCAGRPGDPCTPGGCTVPGMSDPAPAYLPQCDNRGTDLGPCVGEYAGTWLYVRQGAPWPTGTAVQLCPTEQGGPAPCVWVPSVQGNGQGDSGAYLWGYVVPGAPTGPVTE